MSEPKWEQPPPISPISPSAQKWLGDNRLRLAATGTDMSYVVSMLRLGDCNVHADELLDAIREIVREEIKAALA